MPAAAGMRRRTTFRSALTITVDIASPVIAAAKKKQVRLRHHHAAAAVTSANKPDTSRQGGQQRNSQCNLDSVSHRVRLVHTDLPFAEEVKKCGCSRKTTKGALIADRTICLALPAPQTWGAAVIKSPNVNFIFWLIFIAHIISTKTFPALWGVSPMLALCEFRHSPAP